MAAFKILPQPLLFPFDLFRKEIESNVSIPRRVVLKNNCKQYTYVHSNPFATRTALISHNNNSLKAYVKSFPFIRLYHISVHDISISINGKLATFNFEREREKEKDVTK